LECWRLLAHNHWFTVNLYGYRVRLCARCSGYLLGFIAPYLVFDCFGVDLPGFLDPDTRLLAIALFALPYALDWITQSWGTRESSNWMRLATGILLGVDVFLFSRLGDGLLARKHIFIGVALVVASMGYLGKLKRPHQPRSGGGSPEPFCENGCRRQATDEG